MHIRIQRRLRENLRNAESIIQLVDVESLLIVGCFQRGAELLQPVAFPYKTILPIPSLDGRPSWHSNICHELYRSQEF